VVCSGLLKLSPLVAIKYLFCLCIFIILAACEGSHSDLANSTSINIGPTASFAVNVSTGEASLMVNFDASASADIDGSIVSYSWGFGDGTTDTGECDSESRYIWVIK